MRFTPASAPLAALACLLALALPAAAQEVKLTSLDWPPFTGEKLTGSGASAAVVQAAFASEGRALRLSFFPWQRAVDTGLKESGYVGYFPEYRSKDLEATCHFSSSIGKSPLGFAENKRMPVTWNTLDDLKTRQVGVVKGYVNTEAFDAMVATGALKVDAAVDDATNLRKVAAGRLELAVIDQNVMRYLLASQPALADVRGLLGFNAKALEDKSLHVCFRKSPEGDAARALFESGLKKVNVDAINADALSKVLATGSGS